MYLVSRSNADVVHTHFPRNMGKHLVSVFEFDTKHRVRQRLYDRAFDKNCVVLGLGQGAHHLGDFEIRLDRDRKINWRFLVSAAFDRVQPTRGRAKLAKSQAATLALRSAAGQTGAKLCVTAPFGRGRGVSSSLRQGKHFRAIVAHCDGVFKMHAPRAVRGDDCPAIAEFAHCCTPRVDHWLDRHNMARA